MDLRAKTFWHNLVKIGTVLTLAAFVVTLFAGHGLTRDKDLMVINNPANGKAAYWNLSSNGTLRNRTKGAAIANAGYGWDLISDWQLANGWYVAAFRAAGDQREVTAGFKGNQLIWHNSTNGKFCYWSLNSNSNLKNRTRTNGWDMVSDWTLAAPWRVAGVIPWCAEDLLLLNNTNNGKTAFWMLNSNGTLRNRTKGAAVADAGFGWDMISDWQLANGWYVASIHEAGDRREVNNAFYGNQMLWHNSTNGKFCYWTLNSNSTLKNRTKTSGWDLLSDWALPSPWRVPGVIEWGNEDVLQLNNTANGKTAFWVLNSNGTLRNRTRGAAVADAAYGWDMTGEWLLANGWYVADIRADGDMREVNDGYSGNQLIWHNSGNGKFCYWTLNSNATLKNRTKASGWDLLSDWTLPAWRVSGIQNNYD